ncbi:hypothetical protein AWM79_07490 [Pseudomonas agarici]|uniref:Glycine zipper family protein n=1 Tax=Pseudomonas agarici TaxID=46677 RepID=A0A0X1SZF8_PSEAA|nr:DUF6515 family protein [Pseudomonas agarici]AMB85160.1 hypothetical protein AWM79_07490 [Pseudomonas agarici]NWB94120.1 glycine zipper family protein [Pseudomonas agarici]
MKSHIWRWAGVGLLCMSVGAQALAGDRGDDNPQHSHPDGGQRGPEGRSDANEGRAQNNPHFERHEQNPGGQWQGRSPQHEPSPQSRPAPNNLPIQSRPDSVRQTQEPQRGNYSDIHRRDGHNPNWQASGNNGRPVGGFDHPNDHRWAGRPSGHGSGWGPGPQYRPGYVIERFPERNWRVPYRGQDYFFSGGYWYRPQGPRYVVVAPPRGIRVSYLPDYAREVWVGSSLFFLAAGAYYLYQEDTQDYVVVDPPTAAPQVAPAPSGNGYDVVAYPANGQSPQQVQQDGEDCYRWAVQQSHFNPANVTYAPDPAVVQAYRQAQGNCLSSRGYQVNY